MGRRGGVSPPPGRPRPGLQGKQRKWPEPPRQVLPPTRATRAAARRAPPVHTRPGADSSCGLPPWVGTEKAHGDGDGRGGSGADLPFLPPAPPKSRNTYPPQRPNTQRLRCSTPCMSRGGGEGARGRRQVGREGVCREEASAEARRTEGAAGGRTGRRGGARPAGGRPGGRGRVGGSGPLLTWQPFLW